MRETDETDDDMENELIEYLEEQKNYLKGQYTDNVMNKEIRKINSFIKYLERKK